MYVEHREFNFLSIDAKCFILKKKSTLLSHILVIYLHKAATSMEIERKYAVITNNFKPF